MNDKFEDIAQLKILIEAELYKLNTRIDEFNAALRIEPVDLNLMFTKKPKQVVGSLVQMPPVSQAHEIQTTPQFINDLVSRLEAYFLQVYAELLRAVDCFVQILPELPESQAHEIQTRHEVSAIDKMICLLKKVPLNSAITDKENSALRSGKLGEILKQFPKYLELLQSHRDNPETQPGIQIHNNHYSFLKEFNRKGYPEVTHQPLETAMDPNDLKAMKLLLERYGIKLEESIPDRKTSFKKL